MPTDGSAIEGAWGVHDTPVRVRYGEVDRMGYLYHGHYLAYCEQGRTEFLRSCGATYLELEEEGTLLVVVETGLRFLRPAGYDDHLIIRTALTEVRGVRLRFEYELRRDDRLLATGFTVLASCNARGRPKRLPARLQEVLGLAAGDARKDGPAGDVQGAARGAS